MRDGIILWPIDPAIKVDMSPALGWARIVDGRIVRQSGQAGGDWRHGTGLNALPSDEMAMLIVPAADVALHWISCPGMTQRQAAVAAPLMAREVSIGPDADLHAAVAVAPDGSDDADNLHIVAICSRQAMDRWTGWCVAAGVPDAVIVPPAMLLPPPVSGFVTGAIGAEHVVRGPDCAFAGDEPLAALITGDAAMPSLGDAEVADALVAGLDRPPLDLRQGSYARRPSDAIDRVWFMRIAALIGFAALASLLIAIITIARLHMGASTLDDRTLALARQVAPQVADAADAELRLDAMVAARGGAGGLGGMVAAVMDAMQGTPGVTMTSLTRASDGSLRILLSAARAEDINAVLLALQYAGWRIAANGVRQSGAQTIADITIAPW